MPPRFRTVEKRVSHISARKKEAPDESNRVTTGLIVIMDGGHLMDLSFKAA